MSGTTARIAWINTLLNILLTFGKGIVGVITGNEAIIADAVHSGADVVGSVAVVVGLRIARKPPDDDHPYGHGKAELIAASIVAGFLIAAALEVAYSSLRSLFFPPIQPDWLAAWTAFISMLVKESMFQVNIRIAKKKRSQSLMASAYDNRSDVYSSLAALLGILLSLLGRYLHWVWLMQMDGVAGAVVAILVVKMALKIARDSLQPLMDRVVLEDADLTPYRESIEHSSGVCHIDDLRVRDHGSYVVVDVEISVDANLTVAEGHQIAASLRQSMKANFPRILDVFVHVNPYVEGEEEHGQTHD
ncbi:cation diffusion facilitator family transporter [Alicyclobacillus tolerans]|uniref:Cation diffusion facilitator family transporter n=1 Tax=Alicyclobacillus tolerans TaxID=90970 RepID=A0A1M6K9A4_9BACL|nr:cation diffusion facilitator family transporter [Alicyclobacillus montanus]SHJ55568.1 cation diffusion facilitator family transporter [Alicyclobacillus montanus]